MIVYKQKRRGTKRGLALILSLCLLMALLPVPALAEESGNVEDKAPPADAVYSVCGSFTEWMNDIAMTKGKDGIYRTLITPEQLGVTETNNKVEFKVRKDNKWDETWGDGSDGTDNFMVFLVAGASLIVSFDPGADHGRGKARYQAIQEIAEGMAANTVEAVFGGNAEVEGSVIRLTRDFLDARCIRFVSGDWTLDLAGCSVTAASLEEAAGVDTIRVEGGALTLKDDSAAGRVTGGSGVSAGGCGLLLSGGDLIIEGAPTLSGGGGQTGGCGLKAGSGTLTLAVDADPHCIGGKGSAVSGDGLWLDIRNYPTGVRLTGGHYEGRYGLNIGTNGSVILTGGSFSGTENGIISSNHFGLGDILGSKHAYFIDGKYCKVGSRAKVLGSLGEEVAVGSPPPTVQAGPITDADSVQTAFGSKALVQDNVITLLEDVLGYNTLAFVSGQWTFDLNGHDFICVREGQSGAYVLQGAALTVTDGAGGGRLCHTDTTALAVEDGGTLIMKGGTLLGGWEERQPNGASCYPALQINCGASAEIHGGDFLGALYMEGDERYWNSGYGIMVNADYSVVSSPRTASLAFRLPPGTVSEATGLLIQGLYPQFSAGGPLLHKMYYSKENVDGTWSEPALASDQLFTLYNDGFSARCDDNLRLTAMASIGGMITKEKTAEEIITMLGGHEKVSVKITDRTLLQLKGDLALTESLEFESGTYSLDLNGHSLSGAEGQSAVSIAGESAVAIFDSTGGGGVYGCDAADLQAGAPAIEVKAGGSLALSGDRPYTVKGGNGKDNSSAELQKAAPAILVAGGTFQVTGSETIQVIGGDGGSSPDGSKTDRAVGLSLCGDATIDGGTFEGHTGALLKTDDSSKGCTYVINGGTFTGDAYGLQTLDGLQPLSLTVSGGTFEGGSYGLNNDLTNEKSVCSLKGGSYTGTQADAWAVHTSTDTVGDLLASGYAYFNGKGEKVSSELDKVNLGQNDTLRVAKSRSGGSSGGYYTLTATADHGGSIVPGGSVRVGRNGSKTFTIRAEEGYEISDVLVDGKSVGAVEHYTFDKIAGNHTIHASFQKRDQGSEDVWNRFTDVDQSQWFYDSVRYVTDAGLMQGTSATEFSPYAQTTRGMIVTILWRLEGSPAEDSPNSYPDVKPDAYYAEAISWGDKQGIVQGYGDGRFGPEDPITREQLAAVLWRYAKYKGEDVGMGENANLSSFKDYAQISQYALPAMEWACGAEIIRGKEGGILDPKGSADRAQVAAILMRYLEQYPLAL